MGFSGVNTNQVNGGLGRRSLNDDGVCLLVIGGAVATGDLDLKTAVELLTLQNAEDLGIDPSYDDTNNILAYHHIDEFFRLSPSGNLFVILDDGTLTIEDIKGVLKLNQQIKRVGFVRNDSAPADFAAYVATYQNMCDELRAEARNVPTILVEGNQFDNQVLISAYPDAREYISKNVSVVVAQDPLIRSIKSEYETYAAIGSALGMLSVRSVNENLGSVDIINKPQGKKAQNDYPLTDLARSRWLSSVLQSGKAFASLSLAEIGALNDKGYLFVGFYNGYAGMYFNDSHTCIDSASDYSRIENNAVWDKVADLVRQALLPRVKGNLLKDPSSGNLIDSEVAELETLAGNAILTMEAAEEISGYNVYIDPAQDLSDDAPLNIKIEVVLNNIIHQFDVDLGLTNKIG